MYSQLMQSRLNYPSANFREIQLLVKDTGEQSVWKDSEPFLVNYSQAVAFRPRTCPRHSYTLVVIVCVICASTTPLDGQRKDLQVPQVCGCAASLRAAEQDVIGPVYTERARMAVSPWPRMESCISCRCSGHGLWIQNCEKWVTENP